MSPSTAAAIKPAIKDVQGGTDARAIAINRVGICSLQLPMLLVEGSTPTPTVGTWSCYTDLPAEARGTHMSRLVRAIHDIGPKLSFASFCELPTTVLQNLPIASECTTSVKFQAFANKRAPISGEQGYINFSAAFCAGLKNGQRRQLISATVPVTSLCPCSKTISKYGAHNQRSHVTCSLEASEEMRLLDLMSMVEESSSCELYSVLKRPDERHVTERAYNNPKFVEDIVRDLAVAVSQVPGVRNYRITAENFESIHNHDAYAMIQTPNFPTDLLV
ncbi:MAG: GTP cyclohydrolase FolE2 [Gammaproteobacteria bacterium WSBS_2016_MAG_OTU1]